MTDVQTEHQVELTRSFPCNPESLYRKLTTADEIARWFGPEGVEMISNGFEAREGGDWFINMRGAESGRDHQARGRVLELQEFSLVRLSFQWQTGEPEYTLTTELTFTLHAEGAGTRLELRHRGLGSEESATNHTHGWTGSLEKLEALAA